MIARGFKPVGWVAAVGTAALGCYMLSLRVASERADLSGLQLRIVATQQEIRSLQTELGTRGRLQQLEQWNDEVLALSAPVAAQYLHPDLRLARFTVPSAPLETAEVHMASAATAPAPAPVAAPAAPVARHAVADQRSLAPPPPLERPIVQRTSLTLAAAEPAPRATPPVRNAATPSRTVATPPARAAAAAPARTRTASAESRPRSSQSRPASLLDERTLREIGSAARAERGGGGTRD